MPPEKAATGTMDEERWQRWFPSIPDEVLKLMGRVEGEAEVAARCEVRLLAGAPERDPANSYHKVVEFEAGGSQGP